MLTSKSTISVKNLAPAEIFRGGAASDAGMGVHDRGTVAAL